MSKQWSHFIKTHAYILRQLTLRDSPTKSTVVPIWVTFQEFDLQSFQVCGSPDFDLDTDVAWLVVDNGNLVCHVNRDISHSTFDGKGNESSDAEDSMFIISSCR